MTGHYLQTVELRKNYGSVRAVDDVSLDVSMGEMVVLLGPSGCGKTTTLRMIAGFIKATSGDIVVDGRSIMALPTFRRNLGIVFQSYALFPHYTVGENIAFGLEMRKMSTPDIKRRVDAMLQLVKLDAHKDRYPRQLSGGQQQRVALARALAIQPSLLLLDEPLSNLDASLRQDMAREIRLLQQDAHLTTIMVTHDQQEAMSMADRLVVMCNGRVQQAGTQQELYERPANPFVASFIGGSNLLKGRLRDHGMFELAGGDAPFSLAGRYKGNEAEATLALRPERLRLTDPGSAASGYLEGRVELATYLGSIIEHVVLVGDGTRLIVRSGSLGADGNCRLRPQGEAVGVCWNQDAERLFDADDSSIEAISANQADNGNPSILAMK